MRELTIKEFKAMLPIGTKLELVENVAKKGYGVREVVECNKRGEIGLRTSEGQVSYLVLPKSYKYYELDFGLRIDDANGRMMARYTWID